MHPYLSHFVVWFTRCRKLHQDALSLDFRDDAQQDNPGRAITDAGGSTASFQGCGYQQWWYERYGHGSYGNGSWEHLTGPKFPHLEPAPVVNQSSEME